MNKQLIFSVFFFASTISLAQSSLELSMNFNLDQFAYTLLPANDSLMTDSDSIPWISFHPNEECTNEARRDSLFHLIERLKSFEQGTTIDTSRSYTLLFEIETYSSSSQFIFEDQLIQRQGWYCINSKNVEVTGKRLVDRHLSDDVGFHDCFQFKQVVGDSFLIIGKNCVRYGDATDFYTDLIRFYEVVPKD